jgi:hypothetical protein
MLRWIPPEQAPKDGTVIVGKFNDTHPERIVCMWDTLEDCWVGAYPQNDPADGRFFENQHFHADDLEVWAEL